MIQDWSMTHCGTVRTLNEDTLVCRRDIGLWAVADGAGGHHAGEVASGMIAAALDAIPAALAADEALAQVRLRLAAVHDALRNRASRDGGVGVVIASTVVVLLIRDGHFACLWAGDSRAYLLRRGSLQAVTRDHSLVQELVDAGSLTDQEAERHPQANVITRAVGAGDVVPDLDKTIGPLEPGDRFLLCSDGLCKTLDLATLARLTADPSDPAAQLVGTALEAGVRDNVTAVVVETGDGLPAEPP